MSFGTAVKPPIVYGSWERFETLVTIMVENMKHGIVGFIDWNLMLNAFGGPAIDGSVIDACILTDTEYKSFIKQPIFYVMAHFSKFIPPGSRRIDATIFNSGIYSLKTLAYLRPDGMIVVILYNESDLGVDNLLISDRLNNVIEMVVKPKTLYTIIYKQQAI